jgi:hypothetical protein
MEGGPEHLKEQRLDVLSGGKGGAGGGNRTHGLGIMRTVLCYDGF